MTNSFYHHFHFSARRNHYQIKCTFSLLPPYAFHNYMYVHECMLSCFSRVRLIVTLWMPACQAPLSLGFSRQEYWSGLPFPSPIPLQLLFYHFMLGSHHVSNYYLTRLFLTRLSAHYGSTYNSICRLSPRVIFLK